ncbi:hypothetical protein L3Y34_013577 [Caenorhabditis briggsae]|uniref:Uncharacterized protein n=1 Tax=Caenorhabditis briggsae TaxID=6238 RepID=A0AAE9CX70_CAEBR|nr:hypothetical protein L3Y34_013577 [Caenorhabditis briggsae]
MEAKVMEAEMAREAFAATNAKDMGTKSMIVNNEEIKRLEEEGVVVRVEEEPRCVSPLHVVEQGDIGVAKAKWMMQVVGENQKKKSESKLARKKKSPEGPKKDYMIERQAGKEFQTHLDKLKAQGIGSSALSKISVAYQAANQGIAAIGATFVSDVIK